MKIYFDTNIVIDILKRREPYYKDSNAIFMLAIDKKIEGIIGASAITDIYYILKKEFADTKTTIDIIFDILKIVRPVDVFVHDIFHAAKLDFSDFEDAVISAIAYRENADYIITRNKTDFSKSIVPAITPIEFLDKYA